MEKMKNGSPDYSWMRYLIFGLIGGIFLFTARCSKYISEHKKLDTSAIPRVEYKNMKSDISDEIKKVEEAEFKQKEAREAVERENYLFAVKNSILITVFQISTPDINGNINVYFNFINRSNKTVKYVYWEGCLFNEVDDAIRCQRTGELYKSGRIVGPYKPGEGPSTPYVFPNMWTNLEAHHIFLKKVEIVYMDGSKVSVKGKNIGYLFDDYDS